MRMWAAAVWFLLTQVVAPGSAWVFWVDTNSGVGLGGLFNRRVGSTPGILRLGSNGLSGPRLPTAANDALRQWVSDAAMTFESVEFIDRDGRVVLLPVSEFQPVRSRF